MLSNLGGSPKNISRIVHIIGLQHRDAMFLGGRIFKVPLAASPNCRPGRFEKQALVLRHAVEQLNLSNGALCNPFADQFIKITIMPGQPDWRCFFNRSVEF